MALRTCSYSGLGLDEFIVYPASYYVNAVANVTDEVRIVVKELECLRYEIQPRLFLLTPLVCWYCDIFVVFRVLHIFWTGVCCAPQQRTEQNLNGIEGGGEWRGER
jgi:hypothetical protein